MGESNRRSSVSTAALASMAYAVIGIVFALPTTHVRVWRIAAWVLSGVGYGVHIAYERLHLQYATGSAALYVALGTALGTFGLAMGANIHAMVTDSTDQQRHLLLLALGIAPVITAIPAFLVALCVSVALEHASEATRKRTAHEASEMP